MLPTFSYFRAKSVSEAVSHLKADGAIAHAGGTDLLGCLREQILAPEEVVSISAIPKLKGAQRTSDGGFSIGALTTISELASNGSIKEHLPGLAQAASEVASPQLRNQGTIGGNLCQKTRCWYYRGEFHCLRKGGKKCFAFSGMNQYHAIFGSGNKCYTVHPSDTSPMLIALDARIETQGPGGSRTIPAEKFHTKPADDVTRDTVLKKGEIVTSILVPKPEKGLLSSYRKVRARRSWDFALAGCALAIALDGKKVKSARVAFSGAAPFPWRSIAVEQAIIGHELDRKTIERAAEAAVADAEPLEFNEYKVPLFKAVVTEELEKIAGS